MQSKELKEYSPPAIKQLSLEEAKRLLLEQNRWIEEEAAELANPPRNGQQNVGAVNPSASGEELRRWAQAEELATVVRRVGWMRCPYCGDNEIYRSRRGPLTRLDRFCGLFLLQLVRCHGCHERHYRPIFLPAREYSRPVRQVQSVRNDKKDEKHERSA